MLFAVIRLVFIWAVLLAVSVAHAEHTPEAVSAEVDYFKTRDDFRARAGERLLHSDVKEQVAVMQKKLEAAIGPVNVTGFPLEGRPTIRIVSNDPCCDQIDALLFVKGEHETLFVTTRGVVDNYVARHPEEFKGIPKADGPEYYFSILATPPVITNFADVPVNLSSGKYFIHAFAGVFANEGMMGYSPDRIFVFASEGSRLYIYSAPMKVREPWISECQDKWSVYSKKAHEAREKYFESDKQYPQYMDVANLSERTGFKALYTCYQKRLPPMRIFAAISRQAQEMADRLTAE